VGAAGSGKTALLRHVLLDLLSAEPTLPAIAEQHGRHLPIWIPFAYWTHTLRRQPGASIVDVLRGWFHSWGEDELFLLIQQAVEDERLFLIVDGLDEWADEPTGTLAFAQFESFLDMRNLPAISSARPYALNWLKLSGIWRMTRIADLTSQQRKKLCEIWFRLRAQLSGNPDQEHGMRHDVESLIADLEQSIDLDELSRMPLFLLLLIALRFQSAALPVGRFRAHEALIRHMLRDHPQRKRSAAAINPEDQLSEREIETILSRLAFEIQVQKTGGTITQDDFETLLLRILTSDEGSGLGLSSTDARKIANSFINIEEGSLGLLVPQGMRTFGFLHRSFQERLAALYSSNQPLESQLEIVRIHANDPQWRETLLHLCSMTSRPDELSKLLSAVPDLSGHQYTHEGIEELRIEVAFSDFDLPFQEVKEIVALAFNIIEHSTDVERRRRILRHCLNGLNARRTRELIQPKLNEWSISRSNWGANAVSQLKHWLADDLTKNICQRCLNGEDVYVIRAAAGAYANVFQSDSGVADEFVGRALKAQSVDQRAACIEALVAAWPNRPELPSISVFAINSDIPLLKLVGLYAKSKLGHLSEEDAVEALEWGSDVIGGPIPYQWKDLVREVLLEVGKTYKPMVKNACLFAVKEGPRSFPRSERSIDPSIAWFILLTSYTKEPEVISALAKVIAQEHPFIGVDNQDVWKIIASRYRGVEEVQKALDARIDSFVSARPVEAHYAALLTQSAVAKKSMLEMLQHSFPHWAAAALLEGWGAQDSEVSVALRSIVLANNRRASELASFIPQVLGKAEARERLIQLLGDPEAFRLDFIIAGLFQDQSNKQDEELISKVIKAIKTRNNVLDENAGQLIVACPESPQVRAFALEELKSRTPAVAQIAASYPNDMDFRLKVAAMIAPLSRDLRSDIVASLSRAVAMSEQAESILSRWDSETDASIKTAMSIGYHSHLSSMNKISDENLELLTLAAKSYGPDHDERRQAAFCALALLKKFEIYFEYKETIGQPTGLTVPLERGIRTNFTLLDFVASHWKEIKDAFGDGLLQRLSSFSTEENSWKTLLSVAHQNSEMASDAQKSFEKYPDLQTSPEGLRFIAKARPRSSQLREAAMKAINASARSWMDFLPIDAACEILLDQFKDDRLHTDLLALAQQIPRNNGPMLVLCLGWPESSAVQGVLPHLNSIDQLVAAYAFFSAAPITNILEKLPHQLHHAVQGSYWGRYIRRPIVFRLLRDVDLAGALYDDMISKPSAWRKCAYAHLVARTQGLTQSGREWVLNEYNRQKSLASSEFGYDVIYGGVRSVPHSLKDAIASVRALAN